MSEEIASPKSDVGNFSVKDLDADALQALETAVREVSREEALRVFLDKFERFARKSLGQQFSSKEIGTLKEALVRAIGALDSNTLPADDSVPCPSSEELMTERGRRMRRTMTAG